MSAMATIDLIPTTTVDGHGFLHLRNLKGSHMCSCKDIYYDQVGIFSEIRRVIASTFCSSRLITSPELPIIAFRRMVFSLSHTHAHGYPEAALAVPSTGMAAQ